MFSRTAQVLLRQKYEADTEKVRSDYEKAKNGVIDATQEVEVLRSEHSKLIEKNRELATENKRLSSIIGEQELEIIKNNNIINQFHVSEVDTKDRISKLKSELGKLDKVKINKLQEIIDIDTVIDNKNSDVAKSITFLNKLDDKINIQKLELESIKKSICSEITQIEEKRQELLLLQKEITEKDLNNRQENDRLEKYRERLNKTYKELGINIKL